jgi:hypothetical protein
MTCKDCVHYDVCKIFNNGRKENIDAYKDVDVFCRSFKPESRFIELPCEVGQTVYFLDVCRTAEDFGKRFVNFGVVAKVSCDYEFVVVKGGSILDWRDVFLSREDAEKALKGENA